MTGSNSESRRKREQTKRPRPQRGLQALRPHREKAPPATQLPSGQREPGGCRSQSPCCSGCPTWRGSRGRGPGPRPGACCPGRPGRRPGTRSASPQGLEGAGRAARGPTRSGGRCLQAQGAGAVSGVCPQGPPSTGAETDEAAPRKSKANLTPTRQSSVTWTEVKTLYSQ